MVQITNTIKELKDGRKVWQCASCDRWFTVKKNNRVDALGVLDGNQMTLHCIGCTGGYEATLNYLRCAC